MYHGIVLDQEFTNLKYSETLNCFAKRKSSNNDWVLYGIGVKESELQSAISNIQKNMKTTGPYYAHLYDDREVIVIFKDKVFKVLPHESTWKEIKKYGSSMGIPEDQLDFWPNRFQDEHHYFDKKDYL